MAAMSTLSLWYLLCTGELGALVTQMILVMVLPSPAGPYGCHEMQLWRSYCSASS